MQFAYHNTLAKLISTTDPLGNSRTQSYTPDGQLATITVPGGNTGARTSTLEYNAAGDPVKAIDPLGNETLRQTDGITRVTRTE